VSAASSQVAWLYERALRLYPRSFQDRYAEPMSRALRDALADRSLPRPKFFRVLLRDFFTSLVKEHFAMLRETYSRPALIFNALVLAGISTVLALALYVIPQQVLRTGADDPQIQLATDAAARIENGAVPPEVAKGNVDITRSLAPFVIVYNDRGQTLASTAQFHGQTPAPPAGIFDYVRTHGEERVTWQPERGVRIASVIERVNGSHSGFVLAGRSLREVQARIDHVQNLAGLTWLGMLGMILLGSLAFGWMTRRKTVATAV
jgi:hypothetical protein